MKPPALVVVTDHDYTEQSIDRGLACLKGRDIRVGHILSMAADACGLTLQIEQLKYTDPNTEDEFHEDIEQGRASTRSMTTIPHPSSRLALATWSARDVNRVEAEFTGNEHTAGYTVCRHSAFVIRAPRS